METGFFVASMLGIIPALLLRFYMLRPFEGLYKDMPVFFAFVIGMVVGFVPGVLHAFVDSFALTTVVGALLFFVIGFAFFDQFMRVVIFNSPRFSGQQDTVFYATTFGLGYSGMLAALWFYRSFVFYQKWSEESGNELGTTAWAWIFVSYVAAAFAFAVVHGVTGLLVGFGAYEGILWRYGILGVLIQAPLNILWWLALASSPIITNAPVWELGTISMLIAAAYGVLLLRWNMRRIVPELLPTETMRGRLRELRRRRRAKAQPK